MNPNQMDGDTAFQQICFKTYIALARNVADFPFVCPNTPSSKHFAMAEKWSQLLQRYFRFEDVTADEQLRTQGFRFHRLTPDGMRSPAYRLLRLDCVLQEQQHTIWCELMTENHFTFSVTINTPDLVKQTRVLEFIADEVAKHVKFAYDAQWGYLTAEPIRTGSGLFIRSWTHLLGLTLADTMPQALNAAEVKGVFGEKDTMYESASSEFYHFSNRFSINLTPTQIVRDFKAFLVRLAKEEHRARLRLAYDQPAILFDLLSRARFLFQQVYLPSPEETLYALSLYWTACSVGALEPLDAPQYQFATCFDWMADECCESHLLPAIREQDVQALPAAFLPFWKNRDPEMLRALWLRPLGEAPFSPAFLNRINHK
ncbi:MAG: hypothetical protein IKW23_01155 [Kiritimatiellae bacterium]|nr:hypothetical protein [Kiritimatiellia bacterium]